MLAEWQSLCPHDCELFHFCLPHPFESLIYWDVQGVQTQIFQKMTGFYYCYSYFNSSCGCDVQLYC